MNPKLINALLIAVIVGLIAYLVFGQGDNYKEEYLRLEAKRDSLSDRVSILEHINDSIVIADLTLLKQLDSARNADVTIVIRETTRNNEYEQIYNYLDTVGRSERYEYLGAILSESN